VRTTKPAILVLALVAMVSAACGMPDPPIIASATTLRSTGPVATDPVAPADSATPTPSRTPESGLAIGSLRRPRFDPTKLTVVCGRNRADLDGDLPQPSIECATGRGGALALGLAAIQTVADRPIERLYLQGNRCPTTGCTDEAFQVGTVVGWTKNGDAYRTLIDLRISRVSVPIRDDSIEWPRFGTSEAPAIQRPVIKTAPAEVTDRTPYPFCGVATLGEPPSVARCFRDAVLDARPAEMILHTTGAEGFPMLELYRFAGKGVVVRYRRAEGQWSRTAGTLILEGRPMFWYLEQWNGTVKIFD
jgi:hypothetical protein